MRSTTDAWTDTIARALVSDLADRGLTLQVRLGRLQVAPRHRISPEDDRLIRAHRDTMIIIVLACDDRTLDRLLDLKAGRLQPSTTAMPGHCHLCDDVLPVERQTGRCGWCSLAVRLHVGAPLPADLLKLFPASIRGPVAVPVALDGALPFDTAVPA